MRKVFWQSSLFSIVLFTIFIPKSRGQQGQPLFRGTNSDGIFGNGSRINVHNSPTFGFNRFTSSSLHHNYSSLNYLVLTPQIIQPDSIFRILVHTFIKENSRNDLGHLQGSLTVSIIKDGVNLQSIQKEIEIGQLESAELRIPTQLTNGTYKVQVLGTHSKVTAGILFQHAANLTFSENFLAILIQMNRPVYAGGSTIRFRCILLQRNLQSYGHPAEIYIFDPHELIMRKWPSVTPKFGVIELAYELPEYSITGNWKIRIQIGSQTQEKSFRVDRYFKHLYEVMVSVPPFLLATDEAFTATISPFFATEKGVIGNGTVRLLGQSKDSEWVILATENFIVDRSHDVTWNVHEVLQTFHYGPYSGSTSLLLRVEAHVTDFMVGETRSGYADTRIIHQTLQLQFMSPGPPIFKPGLQFRTHILVSYNEHQKVPKEVLQNSKLKISVEAMTEGRRTEFTVLYLSPDHSPEAITVEQLHPFDHGVNSSNEFSSWEHKSKFNDYVEEGLAEIKFKVPKKTSLLILKAEYSDSSGSILISTQRAYPFYSPTSKFINVICTKKSIVVGEFAMFQFASNFFLDDFHYLVMSKGLILQYGSERFGNPWTNSKSFSVPVSSQMSPGFQLIVYHVTRKGEVLAHSIFIPVSQFSRNPLHFRLNEFKDRTKDSVEAGFFGDAGSYVALSCQRSLRHFLQAGNELSLSGILENFYSLEPLRSRVSRVLRRDPNGESSDQIRYLKTMIPGIDSAGTFHLSSLLVFSNNWLPASHVRERCETRESCVVENCLSFIDKCGIIRDCFDYNIHFECPLSELDLIEYRSNRTNPILDFYDPIPDGDWAWSSGNVGPHGNVYMNLAVPKTTDKWYLTAFSISPSQGFVLVNHVIMYDSARPFMMTLDAPTAIKRGEQVGIQVILSNNEVRDIYVTVILHASSDYQFVKLGVTQGNVDETHVELLDGEHHHFVWIPAGGQLEVRLPVRPTIEQGKIEVHVSATTQIRSDTGSVEINVLAEGAQIGKHTSLLLDLKNRATVLKFLNIYVEESPLNPRDPTRKYIYGSPAGHVTVYGDVLGPIFPSLPVDMNSMLGKPGQGTADRLFDLAINVWSLHYLRLTNQLKPALARQVFVDMNKSLATIMCRYERNGTDSEGSFRMWDTSTPSVWLSAWALQIFTYSNFQDWENYFLVEDSILVGVTTWLIQNQNLDGTFGESGDYQRHPLNKKMSTLKTGYRHSKNISLTAHVTLALHLVIPYLDGNLKVEANVAKFKAIQYLELHLSQIQDPFQMAIVTYLLTLVDSTGKDAAFFKLYGMRTEAAGYLYWSPEPIPSNEFIYENQRPFLQAKNNEFWDSYAVEATAYALLVCLHRDGVTPYAEQIVNWLTSMKLTDGAFISSLDTAVAFQALTEYSNRARLRDLTQLNVAIELSGIGNGSEVESVQITPDTITTTHVIDIANVWGHVNIIARGAGQAVVQLDVTYGIEWEELKDVPPKHSFDLKIRELFSQERNKTALTLESCFRWTLLEESETSGVAVLEIEIPSGYSLVMSDALDLINSGIHPTLRDVLVSPGKTSWYFDYIPSEWTCFNHTVRRWYPVANLSTSRQSTIYEAFAIERFENVIIRDISLQELTICHVCGSFQCPYCPFFSGSHQYSCNPKVIFILFILKTWFL